MNITTYTNQLKMEELPNPDQFSYGHIQVTHVFLGKDITSPCYGKMIGFFQANQKTYKFSFHIHKPNQRFPHLSNKMTDIAEIVKKSYQGISYTENEPTSFGQQAFWLHTPDKTLQDDPDSFALRQVMRKLTDYSRKNQLCAYFCKNDRKYLKFNGLLPEKRKPTTFLPNEKAISNCIQ